MSTEEDLVHIKNQRDWSNWPVLPLKNTATGSMEIGILYADGEPVVYLMNMWDLGKKDIQEVEQVHFSSFEEMTSAGWRVD